MEDVERDLLHYFNNSMLGQFYQFLNVMPKECEGLIQWDINNNNQIIIHNLLQLKQVKLQLFQGSRLYTSMMQLGQFGFENQSYISEQTQIQKVILRHPHLNSSSTMKQWARVWLYLRIGKYFDRSAVGILYYELKLRQSKIAQWVVSNTRHGPYILIKDVQKFNLICSRSNIQQKGIISLKRANFKTYQGLQLIDCDTESLVHPVIKKDSPKIVWIMAYEKLKNKDRIKLRKKHRKIRGGNVKRRQRKKITKEVFVSGHRSKQYDRRTDKTLKKQSAMVVEIADKIMSEVVSFNIRHPQTFEDFEHLVQLIKSLKDVGQFYQSLFEIEVVEESSDEYIPSRNN